MRKRRHVRWSTVIYSKPAYQYEPVERNVTTTQTLYYDLDAEKRKQLYRAYQELVCYVPWKVSPEHSFLSVNVQELLKDKSFDPEMDSRYSLRRLEFFHKKYMELWEAGDVAKPGTQWQRDNQYCYTMHLTNQHNRDIRLDRADNNGVFTARYEAADELVDTTVELRAPITDELEEPDVLSALNFLPADTFREILEQEPPKLDDIKVAFPLEYTFQRREELVAGNKATLFMADPPAPTVPRENMTYWHNKAIDLVVGGRQQVIYIYGKAGTGKTEVALHICQHFKGAVQAGAGTGKASSNFNGPTTHAMFGWSHDEFRQVRFGTSEQAKLDRLRIFYENTKVFVIDEINAVSAAQLGLMDEMMCKIFDPDRQQKLPDGTPKPFGGKTMVFMGDSAQLRPVDGVAIYDSGSTGKSDDSFGRARNRLYCSQVKARAARGQQLYVKFLSPSCIWLKRGFRNRGLLEEIFDRVRNGQQTRDDLEKIMYQRGRFPQVLTDCGIHYSNESCTLFNYQDLWRSCQQQQPPTRVYVSRAGYHTTGDNDQVVRTLSTIQSNQYQFAPDVLCVAEGCEVRLVKNLNVAAGLVNSASGTVSRVIYNNADVPALMRGEHPPAYCIVVRFPGFRGFLKSPDSNEREFPLPDRQLVPLYRVKFFPDRVPGWIRKKQSPSTWYREQFPIDLSRHITAHRAQGQTWKNRLLSVNLNLESPDNRTPPDVASIIYVACTRINELKNLFVQPIFPTVWDHIGQSEMDKLRRQAEDRLQKDAEAFALKIGSYREFQQEQAFVPDYTNNAKEWQDIVGANEPPPSAASTAPAQSMDIDPSNDDGWLSAVASERHIGIDQGVRNWAMVAVDRTIDSKPIVVGAELYDLRQEGLNVNKFDVADLVLILQTKTVLTSWMQLPGHPALDPPTPHVDRVIVHIEQISKKNKYNKQFTIDLGRSLQRLANVERCVVKLSHPHVHRRTGPMFKMGNRIVAACGLSVPSDESTTSTQRKRRTKNRWPGRLHPRPRERDNHVRPNQVDDESDVEPDDVRQPTGC
jgi:RecA/RadA recombinase